MRYVLCNVRGSQPWDALHFCTEACSSSSGILLLRDNEKAVVRSFAKALRIYAIADVNHFVMEIPQIAVDLFPLLMTYELLGG